MKRLLYLALAAITITLASCGDKGNNPEVGAFQIKMNTISHDQCYFTVTPTDNSVEWMYYMEKANEVRTKGAQAVVQYYLNGLLEDGETYESLQTGSMIYHGVKENIYYPLSYDNEYAICVFQVNEKLELVGDVTYTIFTAPSIHMIDLGLPSGTLWRSYELDDDNDYPLLLTYTEAAQKGTIPTRAQWDELLNYCSKNWKENSYGSYLEFKGLNDQFITLYATGQYDPDGKLAEDGEWRGYYWTSTQSGSIMAQNDVFIFYWDKQETNFTKRPYATQNVCGAILVADNPNKK